MRAHVATVNANTSDLQGAAAFLLGAFIGTTRPGSELRQRMENVFLSQQGIVVLSNAATYFQGDARMVDAVNMATDAFGDAIMAGPRASEFKRQVHEQATLASCKYGPGALAKMRAAPPVALAVDDQYGVQE